MKSLVEISVLVLQECSMKCAANPYRDSLTITRRTENEGDSFLTITLPSFCKGFERSLAEGRLSPAHFPSFRRGRGTCLPKFLSGFMERIFNSDGALRPDASSDCILAIRQICLLFKKVLLPCTSAREKLAEKAYLDIERGLKVHACYNSKSYGFRRVSAIISSSLFAGTPFGDPYNELLPRHGPGTTREGLRGNKKYLFPSWPLRLEAAMPFSEFGCASISNFGSGFDDCQVLMPAPRDEDPVRVVFVPKTLKSPRVIGIEPVCMQYTQQSLSDWLRPRIETLSPYTSGHVNFTSQSINANLALSSSKDGRYATIDLSEASDRVTCLHVRDLWRSVPAFSKYVFATRTTRAELPSGDIIPLRKFASMGSAMCFPMESLVFFNAIVACRIEMAGVRITPKSVLKYSREVYVYGDDIIVPTDEAATICVYLEAFGLKVNAAKSFWTGKFRESCGMDAYDGVPVTPVYCRHPIPTNRAEVNAIVSWVAFANQLYWAGYWSTSRAIRLHVEGLLGKLPSVSTQSGMIGWQSFSQAQSFNGWHNDYQRLKLRCLTVVPIRRDDPLEGDPALLKCFVLLRSNEWKLSRFPSISPVDDDHLLKSVRYGNLALKRRWA